MSLEQEFNQAVEKFEHAKDNNGDKLNMHYFLMKDKDNTLLHRFNGRTEKSDIRSISKTVMTLIVGVVNHLSKEEKHEFFDENTFVYPVLKDVIHLTNEDNKEYLKEIQIKHLLTHTVGFEDVLLMRDDIKDMDPYSYLDYLVNHPIVHKPGEYYLYSNAGFYLLSAFLQEFLQEDLLTFVKRELFDPLNIEDFHWEKYGNYLAGATRLWLFPEDLLKIGELLLNQGIYDNNKLIDKKWFEKMLTLYFHTEEVDTPGANFRRYGYGYGTWLAKKNFYFGHGTDGQTLTILPEQKVILLTQAYQHDVKKLEEILDEVVTNIIE